MRAYSIFDDFGEEPAYILRNAGVELTLHPEGFPRPDDNEMKCILEKYDCVIIGTSQKVKEDIFQNISCYKIIATASVGLDHIAVPKDKKNLIRIFNTPEANAQSVAEFTMGAALSCCKRLFEGTMLYAQGKNNRNLSSKPEDLFGKTIGVVGAGNISMRIMEYAAFFGMNVVCWTAHPKKHFDLLTKGVRFVSLSELTKIADVVSVNLPDNSGTVNKISAEFVEQLKNTAIFISVSRLSTLDYDALFHKAEENPNFYVVLDLDVNNKIVKKLHKYSNGNVIVTPHIGGGTLETRKRMFKEIAVQIAEYHLNAK